MVTVTAFDNLNHVVTAYTGTVTFSSSDTGASLPGNHTFTGSDAGTFMADAGVIFIRPADHYRYRYGERDPDRHRARYRQCRCR